MLISSTAFTHFIYINITINTKSNLYFTIYNNFHIILHIINKMKKNIKLLYFISPVFEESYMVNNKQVDPYFIHIS